MQREDLYPNLEVICRLCLKENTGTENIYNEQYQNESGYDGNLSIPMRIMACVALEVRANDGLPKKICAECRYLLEKSYLLRKQSQESDVKLRKHIRLLSLGKPSKVFRKDPNEDDNDDEHEFYESLEFIKQHEDKIKMRAISESALEKCDDKLKAKCKEELRAEVELSVKNELRQQIQEDMEKQILAKLKMECLQEARKSLRDEVIGECRKREMQSLLDDLQSYLKEKQISRLEPSDDNVVIASKILPFSSAIYDGNPTSKISRCTGRFNKVKEASDSTVNKSNYRIRQSLTPAVVKPVLILSGSPTDKDTNVNAGDGDSDNCLIFDAGEAFALPQKSNDGGGEEDDRTLVEGHIQAYDSGEEQMDINSTQEFQETSTISYRNVNNDNTDDRVNDASIMIINYPNEVDEQETLGVMQYTDDKNGNRALKPVLKRRSKNPYKSKSNESNNTGSISTTPGEYTTVSTVKPTLMTKNLVNTLQPVTDTPKMFMCNDCPMVFTTKHSFERHLRIHRKVEVTGVTFKCPECHIVVSRRSSLRRHMFTHSKQKPFACVECGKSFIQKELLRQHMQTHTGIKAYKCHLCGRFFGQRINLQQHINRFHKDKSRTKQYSCRSCPKRFNHTSSLSRHVATHSNAALQCSECDRTFGDRYSIKRHIANKHVNGQIVMSEKSGI